MKKLLSLKTMINGQIFSFLKNVIIFLVDRLYKEWRHILGNGRSYNERASELGDLYAKHIIENIIHDRANKYDPYVLNENTAISYGIANIVLGKAHVTGISSLHRANICSLTEEGNRLFINANLGAGPLLYRREIVLRIGNFQRKAAFLASLTYIKVSIDFSVEKETGRDGFLLNFAIQDLNGFKLSVDGSGYFDWVINLILSFWMLVLGKIARNLLENEMENYIVNRLPKYQFPVEGTTYWIEQIRKNQHEGIQNSEIPFSKSTSMEQNHETPKLSKISPVGNSVHDGHNSMEYGNAEDFRPNIGITKTSSCFPETTNKSTTKINSYLPAQSCSESSNEDSSNEVSKDKTEDKYDRISEISRKTREISKSLNIITKKLDLVNVKTNSWVQKGNIPNCLNILDDFSLLDRNIPEKSNCSEELEYHSSESAHCVTSSLASAYENKQWCSNCEIMGKGHKSKREDFSEMLEVPHRDKSEISFEVSDENPKQYQLLEEIFSEINERSCKNNVDGNANDIGIELPVRMDICDSPPSKQYESSHLNKNVQYSTETEKILNLIRDFDSERRESQIEYLERMFNGKKRKRIEVSSKDKPSSVKGCTQYQSSEGNFSNRNFDLKRCSTELFQNEPLLSCTIDEFEKQFNAPSDVFSQEHECNFKNTESKSHSNKTFSIDKGVETPEIQRSSKPKGKDGGRNLYVHNLMSDIMNLTPIHQKNLDLESDNEMISTSVTFSEKHENETNEKIPISYIKVYSGEEYTDSQLGEEEGYSAGSSSPSEELISFEGQCDPLTEVSVDALETSELPKTVGGKPYSLYQLGELECLNKWQAESRDSIAELKMNENSNENSSEEMSPRELLHGLQEEIIAQTRKLVSDDVVLESDQESSEYSISSTLRYKNTGCQLDESTYNEVDRFLNKVNQFLQRDSEKCLNNVSRENGEDSNLSAICPINCENLGYFEYPTDSETETSSETNDEQKPESDTS